MRHCLLDRSFLWDIFIFYETIKHVTGRHVRIDYSSITSQSFRLFLDFMGQMTPGKRKWGVNFQNDGSVMHQRGFCSCTRTNTCVCVCVTTGMELYAAHECSYEYFKNSQDQICLGLMFQGTSHGLFFPPPSCFFRSFTWLFHMLQDLAYPPVNQSIVVQKYLGIFSHCTLVELI